MKSASTYIGAYKGHPQEIWVLSIVTFINRFGTMVLPFLTVYLTTVLEFSLNQAGQIMGAFGFGSLGGSYFGGKLSDKIGPRPIILISLIFGGIFFIFLQFFTSYVGLMIIIFIAALFGESYRPAMMSMVGEVVPSNKTARSVAFLRLAINLGFSAAPALGGIIAISLGYNYLFWIDGVTCILAAMYFAYASSNWKISTEHTDDKFSEKEQGTSKALGPMQNPVYIWFLLATFIMGFTFIQWFHSIPVFFKSEWGYNESYIGLLLGGGSLLIVLLEMPLIDSIEKAGRILPAMILGVLFIGLSFLPLLLPKAMLVGVFGMFLLIMGEMLHLPLGNSTALNLSPRSKRGSYMSWFWITWSLVNILGPVLGLGYAGEFGFHSLWVLLAVLNLISAIIFIRIRASLLA
jgi:MFS family permease